MDTPAGGRQRRPFPGPRAAILGSLSVPGRPEQVSVARKFVAQALDRLPGVDSDAATLLTSEVVTNAITHTDSGAPGGTVTVVIVGMPDGVLIEVMDDGSAGVPVVKGDPLAAEGQGLVLVQQMAAHWGYLRDPVGTTVWFHLAAARNPRQPSEPEPEPPPGRAEHRLGKLGGRPLHPIAMLTRAGKRQARTQAARLALTASRTPAQIRARSSSPVTYGGMV